MFGVTSHARVLKLTLVTLIVVGGQWAKIFILHAAAERAWTAGELHDRVHRS